MRTVTVGPGMLLFAGDEGDGAWQTTAGAPTICDATFVLSMKGHSK